MTAGADKRFVPLVLLTAALGCQTQPSGPVTEINVIGSHGGPYIGPSPSDRVRERHARILPYDEEATHRTARALKSFYSSWRGVPHRYGGVTRTGIDCSGFVHIAYRDVFGAELPRTTRAQSRLGRRVSRDDLIPGDLVLFKTGWRKRHVGIYIGDNAFIHASESKGVTRSALDERYWNRRFWKARRPL